MTQKPKPTLTHHQRQEAIKRLNAAKETQGEIARSYDVSRWTIARTFEYRHRVNTRDGLFACLAKLRKGLFVSGFAATEASILPSEITATITLT
jgi:hypothetical protein